MTDVAAAFDRGAASYDLLVSLNPGYHRHLRSAAAVLARLTRSRPRPVRLLDLACGSGASTRALLDACAEAGHGVVDDRDVDGPAPRTTEIVGVDLSEGMLARAQSKTWPAGVEFRRGRVGELDLDELGERAWSGALACYLVRNIPSDQRDAALLEVRRLLEPGGRLVIQEYSVAGNLAARLVWDVVSWSVIIPLGALVDRNPGLYRYLWRSVRRFDSPAELVRRLAAAGFTDIRHRTVPGWQRGILHTFVARNPAR
ncbi:class I SAM-dependent methyltransferase [Salana multivorans]